ncbi:MAG: flagellar basal body rod protein FlgC [Spirochaetia bacterium]|nr:flagellar basal body rod protein FlgC [Spirochaetia bacterium]
MGLFSSINTSSTGLTAQRLRMDVISDNIANATTTRTTEGGPYKRSRVILRPRNETPVFQSHFLPESFKPTMGTGVRVIKLEKDNSPSRLVYDPTHPDAIKSGARQGYVEMPNVNVVHEMVDMISASRAYEANVTMVNASKTMFRSALGISSRG